MCSRFVVSFVVLFCTAFLFLCNVAFAANTQSAYFDRGSNHAWEMTTFHASTSPGTDGDLTVEAWVKLKTLPSVTDSDYTVYRDYGNTTGSTNPMVNMVILKDNDEIQFHIRDGNNNNVELLSSTTLEVGHWVHIAGTWNHGNNTSKLYVNGVEEASGQNNSVNDVNVSENQAPHIGVGALNSNHSQYMDGYIDEVRIWNDVRSAVEISTSYQMELEGDEDNLIGYWQFDNNAEDETSNDNDLTAENSAPFSDYTNYCHGT